MKFPVPLSILCAFLSLIGDIGAKPQQKNGFLRKKREIMDQIRLIADKIEDSARKGGDSDTKVQNNVFERKKRAVIEAFIDEALSMSEEDLNKEPVDQNPYEELKILSGDAASKVEVNKVDEKSPQDEANVDSIRLDEKKSDEKSRLDEDSIDITINVVESENLEADFNKALDRFESEHITQNNEDDTIVESGDDIKIEESHRGIGSVDSDMIRFILRKVFLLPLLTQQRFAVPLHQPPRESHTFRCYGPASSHCIRGVCSVVCSHGEKVHMYCDTNSVLVKNTGVVGELSKLDVMCGY